MIEWKVVQTLCNETLFNVVEYEDGVWRRYITTALDEALARRIATLPEVEAELVQLRTRLTEADACIEHLYRDGAGFQSCERAAAYFNKLRRQNPDGAEAAGKEAGS